MSEIIHLLGKSLNQFLDAFAQLNLPSHYAYLAYKYIYKHRILHFERFPSFPTHIKTKLANSASILPFKNYKSFLSKDGSRKYLFQLQDLSLIEAVWLPHYRKPTICISSQLGCPVKCSFCSTAYLPSIKNLSTQEILAQVLSILADTSPPASPIPPTNIVFMGMGEPLLNYHNVYSAIRCLVLDFNFPQRNITLSTAGFVPNIYRLASEHIIPNLAVSLSAPNDTLRNSLIPINRKFPIHSLLNACRNFPTQPVCFEYVLIHNINDSPLLAHQLASLLANLNAKVNLIPFNPSPLLPPTLLPPTLPRLLRFQNILSSYNIPTFIRKNQGNDIFAACGNLALLYPHTSLPIINPTCHHHIPHYPTPTPTTP
ncbi:MAG: 23S rRNA (adenine(2503)-C(2))-methyltransferase RlmN [Acidobacteriota bacterium]|nr:23S rRNA (adenine(2503)-C(2))-methyltransferase RlmN [Acidobacteriota bacterium]